MKKLLVLCAIGFVAATSTASAQRSRNGGPVELGVDAGLTFGLDDPNTSLVAIPVQDFRLGYFVTNTFEIEPRFHLMSVHVDGAGTLTTYALEIGALLIPGGDRAGRGLYLRPFGGFTGISASGGGSDSNGFLGGGVGLKIPFADRRLATRMEGNYAHGFSNGGTNQIGLLLGLSFFTR